MQNVTKYAAYALVAAIAFAGGCSSSSSESNSPDGGMQSPDGGMQSPDGGMQSPDGGTQTPTFSLSPNPVKQTVANGHSANVSLTVSRDGAQGDIALSVTGSALLATTPGDGSITYAFNPNPESGSGTSVLTFTVGATASSGLPVTLEVAAGPASLAGNLLSLEGAGIEPVLGIVEDQPVPGDRKA